MSITRCQLHRPPAVEAQLGVLTAGQSTGIRSEASMTQQAADFSDRGVRPCIALEGIDHESMNSPASLANASPFHPAHAVVGSCSIVMIARQTQHPMPCHAVPCDPRPQTPVQRKAALPTLHPSPRHLSLKLHLPPIPLRRKPTLPHPDLRHRRLHPSQPSRVVIRQLIHRLPRQVQPRARTIDPQREDRFASVGYLIALAAGGGVPAADVDPAADVGEVFDRALGLPAVAWGGGDVRVMRPLAPSEQLTAVMLRAALS